MNVMNVTFHDGSTCYALTEASLPSFVEQIYLRLPLNCTGGVEPKSADMATARTIINWDFVAGVTLYSTL